MAAVTICSDFGAQKNKVWHCFHCFPIYFPWSDGRRRMIFVFWMLSLKPTFSLSSFTFIKRLLGSSSVSAIKVVSPAHLKLLIFLLAILIPACASYSLAFHIMYFANQLNKQGDNVQPWLVPNLEPVLCSMSGSNCCFLTCIQISQEAGHVVWYSHLFKNFLLFIVIYIVEVWHSQ